MPEDELYRPKARRLRTPHFVETLKSVLPWQVYLWSRLPSGAFWLQLRVARSGVWRFSSLRSARPTLEMAERYLRQFSFFSARMNERLFISIRLSFIGSLASAFSRLFPIYVN